MRSHRGGSHPLGYREAESQEEEQEEEEMNPETSRSPVCSTLRANQGSLILLWVRWESPRVLGRRGTRLSVEERLNGNGRQ